MFNLDSLSLNINYNHASRTFALLMSWASGGGFLVSWALVQPEVTQKCISMTSKLNHIFKSNISFTLNSQLSHQNTTYMYIQLKILYNCTYRTEIEVRDLMWSIAYFLELFQFKCGMSAWIIWFTHAWFLLGP